MDRFEELRQLRDEYDAAQDVAEAHRAQYHAAIRRLHLSGMSLQEIADRLGISRQRVHQIVGEETPRKRRRRSGAVGAILLTLGGLGTVTILATWNVLAHERVLLDIDHPPEQEPIAVSGVVSCGRAPCPPNLRYAILYKTADGRIVASVGFRPQLLRGREVPPFLAGPGEAILEVTGQPEVPALMSGRLGAYYVDVHSGEIRKRRDYRLAAVVAVSGVTLIGGILLGRYRRAGRRRDPLRGNVVPAT